MEHHNFCSNCDTIMQRLATACKAAGRSAEAVQVLPVTKFHPAQAVLHAARYGFAAVGENRVAELVQKKDECTAQLAASGGQMPRWELIGHLQSNKARLAVTHADRIQSVDSIKLLQRLNQLCEELERPQLPILLQINAGDDPAKHGADLSDAPSLLDAALSLPRLKVDGLMTIAPLDAEDPAVAQECFDNLRQLRDALEATHATPLPVLSMGMTSDLEQAVRSGSTMVRIGTALFGQREY